VIDSQNDHRIAMAFSLLGIAAGGITIEGAECVTKTYPAYWKTLQDLGVKVHE
jgi:3-phosphoshikimate 1-carboxyvinyltransferase